MAVRLVALSRRIVHFDDNRPQVAAIQLRQGMRERSCRISDGLLGRAAVLD